MATLDDFVENAEKYEKVRQIHENLDKNQNDREAFNQHYEDFLKTIPEEIRGEYPQNNEPIPFRLEAVARKIVEDKVGNVGLRDVFYKQAMENRKTILTEAAEKKKNTLYMLVARMEPKAEGHNEVKDAIKKYQEAIKPLTGEKPDFETARKRIEDYYNAHAEKHKDVKGVKEDAAILAALYTSSPEVIDHQYKKLFVKPAEEKLLGLNEGEIITYAEANLGKTKKDENLEFFRALYSIIKAK